MANFQTHLTTATVTSGVLASSLLIIELATPKAAFFYWLLGSLGGVLPDIDAPRAFPSRLLFTFLGLLLAACVVVSQIDQLALWLILPIGMGIYLIVRYGCAYLFAQFTVHRGNFHSLLAALLFGFLTTASVYHLLAIRAFVAWFAGLFVMLGYCVHLVVDEVYSFDYKQKKFKKSWGTALKVMDKPDKWSTVMFLILTLGVFYLTPSTEEVTKILLHEQTYRTILTHLGLIN